jgi:hypothetical protein
MKKNITILLISCVFIARAHAQTAQGDWMVGGGFRLNTTKNNTQIAFAPNVGIFIINNLAVGGTLTIDYTKQFYRITNLGIGPFARYYFTNASVRPFLHTNFNYLSSKIKNVSAGTSSTNTGANYFLGGGAAVFLSDQVSLDLLMGYDHTKFKNVDGTGGFALSIGFQVFLYKHQVDKLEGK